MIVSTPVELISVEELERFLEIVASFVNTIDDVFVDSVENEGHDAHHCWFENAGIALVSFCNLERMFP